MDQVMINNGQDNNINFMHPNNHNPNHKGHQESGGRNLMSQPPINNSSPMQTSNNIIPVSKLALDKVEHQQSRKRAMINNAYKSSNRGSSHNNDRPTHSPTDMSNFSISNNNQVSQITKPLAVGEPIRNNYHFNTINHHGG